MMKDARARLGHVLGTPLCPIGRGCLIINPLEKRYFRPHMPKVTGSSPVSPTTLNPNKINALRANKPGRDTSRSVAFLGIFGHVWARFGHAD